MPDLITGPIDPSPTIAGKGASIAAPDSLFSDIDPFETMHRVGRSLDYAAGLFGTTDPESGRQLTPPQPPATLEELKQFDVPDTAGLKGLHFTTPVPLTVAQEMYEAKQEEIMRASRAANQPGGFGSTLIRGAVGIAAGMLDPVNAAASAIPVVGEARMAAGILASLGEGVAGRLASSAAVGAARGAVGNLPLIGMQAAISQQEQADYTASNAMADLITGSLLGGGLHTIVAGAHDWLGSRFTRSPEAAIVAADPAAREAAMRAAVAAVAEDRPVDVAAYIRLHEPMPAIDARLLRLASEESNLREQDRVLQNARGDVPASATEAEVTLARLQALDEQIAATEDRTARRALQERKDEILANTTPEALQAEAQPAREFRQAGNQRSAIAERLAEIDQERTGIRAESSLGPQYVAGDLMAAWRQRMSDAARDVQSSETVRRAAGAPDPASVKVMQQAETVAKAPPPKLQPDGLPEIKADAEGAQRQPGAAAGIEPTKLEEQLEAARGMLTASERAELQAFHEAQSQAPGEAKAFEAAAQCFLQGLI